MNYNFTSQERFIRYAKIDTTADPESDTFPSSAKQKNLGKLYIFFFLWAFRKIKSDKTFGKL